MFICRSCSSTNFNLLWKLKDAAYGDLFRESKEKAELEATQPFALGECASCKLLQLRDQTNLKLQYDSYLYQSKVTVGLNQYYQKISERISRSINLRGRRVIDIGSNDGSFLLYFSNSGLEVLGVEPAQTPAQNAEKSGIPTIRSYFSSELASEILKHYGKAGLVSVNYTLANVPNINDFLIGTKKLLDDDGLVSIITGYHPDQFSVNMFDYIGHDHLTYFSFNTLRESLEQAGLRVVSAERNELKGGSLHVLAGHIESTKNVDPSINYIKQREDWIWRDNADGVLGIKSRVEVQKNLVQGLLSESSVKFLGLGASISTSYLVNEFEISEYIEFLVDDDNLKVSRYSPRFGIPVISFHDEKVRSYRNAIILAWQHTNVLMSRLAKSQFKGNVIVPLPNSYAKSLV